MAYFDQESFDICCEWGMAGVQQLAPSDVIIIVDVLSFSTSVDIAVSRGAIVYPYRWKDDSAVRYAQERSAELAGPRNRSKGKFSLAPYLLSMHPRAYGSYYLPPTARTSPSQQWPVAQSF